MLKIIRYMNIYIKKNFHNEKNKEFWRKELKEIVLSNFNYTEKIIFVEDEKIRSETMAIIEDGDIIKIIFTNRFVKFGKPGGGRNTYIGQGFNTFIDTLRDYSDYFKTKKEVKPYFYLNEKNKVLESVNKFNLKCVSTLFNNFDFFDKFGINSNNDWYINGDIDINNSVFNDIEEFITNKLKLHNKNSSNDGTYIEMFDKIISFFSKMEGANYGEVKLFMTNIFILMPENIEKVMIILKDNPNKKSVEKFESFSLFLKNKKIIITEENDYDEISDELYDENIEIINEDIVTRNAMLYHQNLFNKFGEKECFLCDWDISKTIIGSHIKRFADIKNDLSMTIKQKNEEATDGENGFWLCASHDKLFEYGYLYIEPGKWEWRISNKLELYQLEYVKKSITKNTLISNELLSKNMEEYILEHYKRTQELNVY